MQNNITENASNPTLEKTSNRRTTAFVLIAAGSFVGFLSCVLAIINPIPDLFNWFLYGLSMLAIFLIMPGLYLLFEN